jgi:hypothetical protein
MAHTTTKKPRVKIVGEDGNAFAILGRCVKAARAAGWDDARITAFRKEATAGDYDHLLRTACEHFDVR